MKHHPQKVRTPEPHVERQRHAEQTAHHRWTAFVMPVLVYVFSFVGPAVVIGIPVLVLGWPPSVVLSHAYIIATLGQGVIDLPAIVLFVHAGFKEKWPGRLNDRLISMGAGAAGAAVLAALRLAFSDRLVFMSGVPAFRQSLALPWPWNMVAAILAVLAYGPGEAIFVVYLVKSFDAAIGCKPAVFSWGVLITAILWGLPHLANVFFFGLQWTVVVNALLMVVIGLAMGVLFKGTRSAWGPIIFWTLANGTSV